MQRQAAELQAAADDVEEAPDPPEGNTEPLGRLNVPVLTAAGRDDMPDFKRGAEEIARLVRQAQATTIDRAAHLAPLEAPDEFRSLVRGFLATLV